MGKRKYPPHRLILGCVLSIFLVLFAGECSKRDASSSAVVGPWKLELNVSPDHPSMTKPITFLLHVEDLQGHAVNDVTVTGTLAMKTMDMGTSAVTFAPKGNGDYIASVKDMDMSGQWKLTIEAAQGSTHVTKDFEVTVSD
jgi:hypothetical protein